MRDPRLDKLADVLVCYCAPVKRGDLVTIVGEPTCMSPVEALFEAILRAGGHPSFHPRSGTLREIVLRHGTDEQIRHVSPFEAHRLATCDVLFVLHYQLNTRSLGRIDPAKVVMAQTARRELFSMSLQRGAAGTMRYSLTEIPSHAAAQDAGMSLTDYEEWVYRAGFLHLPDPVAAWRTQHERHMRAIEFLRTKGTLRFQAPVNSGGDSGGGRRHDGTDLTVDISGRTWLSRAGDENFPDGEIETGPRGADGVVNFSFPVNYRGMEIDGIRLKFAAGRVVEASATKNEDYLIKLLYQDDGARVMGEIAMGTNYEIRDFSRNTFFDEKIGGTFHAAVGAGFPQTGNSNQSALHMDMVCDLRTGGTIHADGELFHQNGRFIFSGWPGS